MFDPLYRAVVRAGEDSGRLDEALDRIAYQLERLDALRRQVRAAMTYPAVVFGLALVVMIVMVAVIVPVFVGIFDEIAADNPSEDTSLPLMTQITVAVSDFVTQPVVPADRADARRPSTASCAGRRPTADGASGTASSSASRGSATWSRRWRWRAGRAPSRG